MSDELPKLAVYCMALIGLLLTALAATGLLWCIIHVIGAL